MTIEIEMDNESIGNSSLQLLRDMQIRRDEITGSINKVLSSDAYEIHKEWKDDDVNEDVSLFVKNSFPYSVLIHCDGNVEFTCSGECDYGGHFMCIITADYNDWQVHMMG